MVSILPVFLCCMRFYKSNYRENIGFFIRLVDVAGSRHLQSRRFEIMRINRFF